MARDSGAVDEAADGLRQLQIADDVRLKKVAPGLVNIMFTVQGTKQRINLADMGFGVSQVLPILMSIATAAPGSTILIEQPELHLHPSAQVALADVLIKAALTKRLSLVLETHSEHILLRIRRRIADLSLERDQVAIYAVDGGVAREIELDVRGEIVGEVFPDGFFEEDWAETVAIAKAAMASPSRLG
jgi:predicted ATPase